MYIDFNIDGGGWHPLDSPLIEGRKDHDKEESTQVRGRGKGRGEERKYYNPLTCTLCWAMQYSGLLFSKVILSGK